MAGTHANVKQSHRFTRAFHNNKRKHVGSLGQQVVAAAGFPLDFCFCFELIYATFSLCVYGSEMNK